MVHIVRLCNSRLRAALKWRALGASVSPALSAAHRQSVQCSCAQVTTAHLHRVHVCTVLSQCNAGPAVVEEERPRRPFPSLLHCPPPAPPQLAYPRLAAHLLHRPCPPWFAQMMTYCCRRAVLATEHGLLSDWWTGAYSWAGNLVLCVHSPIAVFSYFPSKQTTPCVVRAQRPTPFVILEPGISRIIPRMLMKKID